MRPPWLPLHQTSTEGYSHLSETIELNQIDNGREVELHLRETMRITLPEVRTAGFRWSLCARTDSALSLTRDDIQPSEGKELGGTQAHEWSFRAEKLGKTAIVIEYSRPWERSVAPSDKFWLSVRVT
jgi:inhibitor of cysteine peptidase